MKILIDMGHPAQVHLFKNCIWELEERGHEILVTARDKDLTLQLLDAYNIDYISFGKNYKTLAKKAMGVLKFDYELLKISKKYKPDIFVSKGSYAAHVARIMRKPSITFHAMEHITYLVKFLTFPFTNVILTPSCFKLDLGKKQIRYNGYQELAYLHPNQFKPDPGVLKNLGLTSDEKFIILRFVSWSAIHDIGQRGFDLKTNVGIVNELEKYGRVFITSEAELPPELEKNKLNLPPHKFHDLLYYATLYIGEGASIASEAALLGTPVIYVSTLFHGYLEELANEYRLAYLTSDPKLALRTASKFLEDNSIKKRWAEKRKRLLKEKIDVTKFMVDLIEGYPDNFMNLNKIKISATI